MMIHVHNSFISILSLFFFWFSFMILPYALILPVSLLQIQQLTTSQITSYIEYLMQIYNTLVLILHSKLRNM